MKKPVLRKTSNPKKPEEYLKMFEKLKKYALDFMNDLLKRGLYFNLGGMKEAYEDNSAFYDVIESALRLVKNDRIESYLKFMRAKMCNGWLLELTADRVLKPEVEISYPEFEAYCKKEVSNYLEKTEKTQSETNSKDTLRVGSHTYDLYHFIDLYNSNKDLYREINDYSWANKTPSKIIFDLSEIEDRIRTSRKSSNAEYKMQIQKASDTAEYLEVDDKLKWYIIESYKCSFEAYLNDHCGTDSSADVLFSLRSIKDGMYNSHVTISASIQSVDEEKFKTPAVFVVRQVKGKGNDKPNERYWDAIIKLFESNEFGYQITSSYRADSDFHITDLDENEEKKFLKKKPWWNNYLKAQLHYKLISTNKTRILKKESWKAKDTSFDDNGEFNITYHSFMDMLLGLSEHWGGRDDVIQKQHDTIDEYEDFEVSDSEIPFDDYKLYIKNTRKNLYNKIVDAMEKLEMNDISEIADIDYKSFSSEDKELTLLYAVYEAMSSAYRTGYEVGTQSSKYEAYERFWDELKLELDGNEIGEINKTKDSEWIVTIYPEAVMTYSEENGEFGIPDPEKECFEPKRRNGIEWEWEWDYDDEAAAERLFEELPE